MLLHLLNRVSILIFLVLLIFLISTCEPIHENGASNGELESIKITNLKGIPSEYGSLFAVTANGAHPGLRSYGFLMIRVPLEWYAWISIIII